MKMDFDTTWDVEEYRFPFEPKEHWKLKQEFMERHKEKFPEDKLVCLSQVYANITLLGCKYPDKVMRQVSALSGNLGKEYEAKKKTRLQRYFVKASDAAEQRVKGKSFSGKDIGRGGNPAAKKFCKIPFSKPTLSFVRAGATPMTTDADESSFVRAGATPMTTDADESSFVRAEDTPMTTDADESDGKEEITEIFKSSSRICPKDKNDKDEISIIDEPKSESLSSIGHKNTIDREEISIIDKPKHEMPIKPLRKITRITSPQEDEVREHPKISFPQADTSPQFKKTWEIRNDAPEVTQVFDEAYKRKLNILLQKIEKKARCRTPLDYFVLYERSYWVNQPLAFSIISNSAVFSDVEIDLEYSYVGNSNSMKSCLSIEGTVIGEGYGENEKVAKHSVSYSAMKYLMKNCWTLRQHIIHSGEEKVSMEEVETGSLDASTSRKKIESSTVDTSLTESNKGMHLLKLMGWSGGGLGKEEDGIVEPIRPSNLIGRAGLGSNSGTGKNKKFNKLGARVPASGKAEPYSFYSPSRKVNIREFEADCPDVLDERQFNQCISKLLKQFTYDYDMEDLAFSPEFTNEQRKLVHQMARKFKLKSKSYGKDEKRFLVVTRKRSPKELLIYVIKSGGKTEKFELFPPGHSPLDGKY